MSTSNQTEVNTENEKEVNADLRDGFIERANGLAIIQLDPVQQLNVITDFLGIICELSKPDPRIVIFRTHNHHTHVKYYYLDMFDDNTRNAKSSARHVRERNGYKQQGGKTSKNNGKKRSAYLRVLDPNSSATFDLRIRKITSAIFGGPN